jgi:hypothetical protein
VDFDLDLKGLDSDDRRRINLGWHKKTRYYFIVITSAKNILFKRRCCPPPKLAGIATISGAKFPDIGVGKIDPDSFSVRPASTLLQMAGDPVPALCDRSVRQTDHRDLSVLLDPA